MWQYWTRTPTTVDIPGYTQVSRDTKELEVLYYIYVSWDNLGNRGIACGNTGLVCRYTQVQFEG